jgi:hypothetical protein
MNCQRNVNSILPIQLPHKFSYIVARFIHNYFESLNKYWVNTFRFRLQDRCSSKQSDWFDSQFHNQLSNDICACRQINWNRNKTTSTFVGQIAKQHNKSKCNFILIYWIAFFQIFLQIFQISRISEKPFSRYLTVAILCSEPVYRLLRQDYV